MFQLYCFSSAISGEPMLAAGGKVLKKFGKLSRLRDSRSEVGVYDNCREIGEVGRERERERERERQRERDRSGREEIII